MARAIRLVTTKQMAYRLKVRVLKAANLTGLLIV
jgi:hypothetical protein